MRETVKSGCTDEARLDVLERMLDAFDEHDLDAIMALFADDCVFDSPRGPDPWDAASKAKRSGRSGAPR